MWTAVTLHPSKCLNLCKNSFYDCVGVKSQNNESWKSWSWSGNLNKSIVRIRSGLIKMCWILPHSSPEIRILYTSATLASRGCPSHFFRLRLRSCSQNFLIRVLTQVRLFFKFGNPTPVQIPATIIDPTVIYSCFYLRNDCTDSCYCRNEKVTPAPARIFTNFWLRVRVRVRKKNAESSRSRLRHSGGGPISAG